MNNITEYIIEKLKINKNVSKSENTIKERDDEITKDFRQLYKLIKNESGDEEILDSLVNMSEFNDDYSEFYYEFDDNKWYYFLREIVNFDLISLMKNGDINIQDSNHKDIAKLIKKYNKTEIGKKVWNSFR